MNLWTIDALVAATKGELRGDWSRGIEGLTIDSREVMAGDVFVALQAARDGHDFVATAIEKGAAGALVSHVPNGTDTNTPLLLVEDVEDALRDIARAARTRTEAKIIAVTGSAGKTSTKEMMRAAFTPLGRVHASEKSFNNHWGVPLTLAKMPQDTEFGIFEIGMNAPDEIAPLVALVAPDVAVVTNVAPVHLAGFNDEADIAREKAVIFSGLEANGTGLVFGDMVHLQTVRDAAGIPLQSFGEGGDNDIRLGTINLYETGTTAEISIKDLRFFAKLGVPGKHHALNALAVIGAVHALDGDIGQALVGLSQWTAGGGRGAVHKVELGGDDNLVVIDESYNANPLSMQAALAALNLRSIPKDGRKIAVLGDMLELGDTENERHAALAALPEMAGIDLVHTVGSLMSHLRAALPQSKQGRHAANAQEFCEDLRAIFRPGDVIMVKGSNGSAVSRVVKALVGMGDSTSSHL